MRADVAEEQHVDEVVVPVGSEQAGRPSGEPLWRHRAHPPLAQAIYRQMQSRPKASSVGIRVSTSRASRRTSGDHRS